MAHFNRASLATVLATTILLSACATADGTFPSLERRPYEVDGPNVEPDVAAPVASAELPPELVEKVKALTNRHESSDAAYAKDLPHVQSIAQRAAGSAVGSESWVNAHLELSRLDRSRADSVAALRDFDTVITTEGETNAQYLPLLTEAQKAVADDVAAQNAEIERLSQLIGE